tara:strand:+ start:34213 stop:34941 length:729 start_codon:yes stop_codon:yes gene_type:complete
MLKEVKRQKGFNLIELMIALVLGLLVSAVAINIYVKNMASQAENLQLMRLNQDMRSMMDLMVRDIRRSGFATSSPDTNFDCLKSNPFNKIGFFDSGTATVASPAACIVFAYNANDNLASNVCTIESSDRFGFRVSNGVLQMKNGGGTEASCAGGTWEGISNSNVTIAAGFTTISTELDITEMFADADGICNVGEACNICDTGNQCLTIREIGISLTGTLSDGTSQTITEKVRVRNDEFDEIH